MMSLRTFAYVARTRQFQPATSFVPTEFQRTRALPEKLFVDICVDDEDGYAIGDEK